MGLADFEFTYEKQTSTTMKVMMTNAFTWSAATVFEDTGGDSNTELDELSFIGCIPSVEYTVAANKFMCFFN